MSNPGLNLALRIVNDDGETLVVTLATTSRFGSCTWYSDQACTSAVSFPNTITQSATFYLPWGSAPEPMTVSCKKGGTELLGVSVADVTLLYQGPFVPYCTFSPTSNPL